MAGAVGGADLSILTAEAGLIEVIAGRVASCATRLSLQELEAAIVEDRLVVLRGRLFEHSRYKVCYEVGRGERERGEQNECDGIPHPRLSDTVTRARMKKNALMREEC